MLAVDRLGMNTQVAPSGAPDKFVNVRVGFSSAATDRKAVKERLVELTRAAAAAGTAET
jgi:hypothetical protein